MVPLETRVCIDRLLPDEVMAHAMQLAVDENPLNAASARIRGLRPGVMPDIPKVYLAALTGKMWQPGRILRVRFLDGGKEDQKRVIPFAQIWSEYANIQFQFGNDPEAEIRISFSQRGSWSYLGTDALAVPRSQPTMNFGWLRANTADEEYSRVVTHEFGHAIGFIHEHQNPSANIPWDKEAVYDFYKGPPNYWSKEQVDINLFSRYDADITQFSEFDPDSIMLYPIPNNFTIGDFEVGWNSYLSDIDKTYAATIYPSSRRLEIPLEIEAPAIDADIGVYGEVDTYRFQITESGRYRVQSSGESDLLLSLFGPDDDTRFVDEHDNQGLPIDACVLVSLTPGNYSLRVRHISAQEVGGYQIGIYRA